MKKHLFTFLHYGLVAVFNADTKKECVTLIRKYFKDNDDIYYSNIKEYVESVKDSTLLNYVYYIDDVDLEKITYSKSLNRNKIKYTDFMSSTHENFQKTYRCYIRKKKIDNFLLKDIL